MSRRALFLLALAPQILFLAFLVAREEWTLRFGEPVLLEVVPYDPFHPLTGYYQRARLAIGTLDRSLALEPDWKPNHTDDIFVILQQTDELHRAVAYTRQRPDPNRLLFLRGQVSGTTDDHLTVDYGLSEFHTPMSAADPSLVRDGAGERLDIRLKVRVSRSGRSTIEDMLVDGQPFADWNRQQQGEANK